MTSTVLDHTQDLSGVETHRLTSLYELPDFVKQASGERLYGNPETLPQHVYGDPLSRLYPCHTKAATWMSALFFFDKKAGLEPKGAAAIEANILKQASWFHILKDVEQLRDKIANNIKTDLDRLPDEDFALVWVGDDNTKSRNYPVRNQEELKAASTWFRRYRDDFTFADRNQIASKLVEKAAAYSVSLEHQEMIEQTAGLGYCAATDIADALEKRANLTNRSHTDLSKEMRNLATIVRGNALDARDAGTRLKLAAVMDQFDRETKLCRMYDEGGLERPEEILFRITEKHANEFLSRYVQMTSGTVYEKAALETIPLDHVRSWMGDEFADEVAAGGLLVDAEKIAAIAPTLPRGDAEMFDQMAGAARVVPFARDKAAFDQGISMEEMAGMASQYSQVPRQGSFVIG